MFRCSNNHEFDEDEIITRHYTNYGHNLPEYGVPERSDYCPICGDDNIEEIKKRSDDEDDDTE